MGYYTQHEGLLATRSEPETPRMDVPKARESLIGAWAMALYEFNVAWQERAELLRKHPRNPYGNFDPIGEVLAGDRGPWATAMGVELAEIYMSQALARYGEEARKRVESLGDSPRPDAV